MTNEAVPLRGVGGWLAFLILGLMVLGPIRGLGQTFQAISDVERQNPDAVNLQAWVTYKQWSWVLLAAASSVSIAAGYRLWKVHYLDSVRFAKIAIWLIGPGAIVTDMALTYATFGVVPFEMQIVGGLIASMIVAAAWTTYLARSRRVANTYVRPQDFIPA